MIDRKTPGYRAARDSAEDGRERVFELLHEWFGSPDGPPVGLLLIAEDAGVGSDAVLLYADPDEPPGGLTRAQQRELIEQVENAALQQILMYHGLWEGHFASGPNDEAWELYAGPDNNSEIAYEGKTVHREVTADEAFADLVQWMAPWGQEGWRDDYVADVTRTRASAARERAHRAASQPYTVLLSSAANPDIAGGYWQGGGPTRPRRVPVADFAEASRVVLQYISDNELGGGNWTGGEIRDLAGTVVGRVSYNGRVWPPGR